MPLVALDGLISLHRPPRANKQASGTKRVFFRDWVTLEKPVLKGLVEGQKRACEELDQELFLESGHSAGRGELVLR